jgi:hypothetical protein
MVYDHGIVPGLSVDNGTAYSIDPFGEMHAALVLHRWAAHGASKRGEPVPSRLTARTCWSSQPCAARRTRYLRTGSGQRPVLARDADRQADHLDQGYRP